ncbi:MAG: S-layer homology domain-containing protein [Acetobacteraceae bacterium]|nr:S-layer homology domain-containing protein [Acetobacteraceae bacterium]
MADNGKAAVQARGGGRGRGLRKAVSLLAAGLVLAALAAAPPVAGAAAPELRVPEVEGAPATDVKVQVFLTSQGEVAGIQFELSYDSGLLSYQGVTAGGLPSGWAAAGNAVGRGRARIMVYSLEGRTVAAGTRPVAEIAFRVAADAEAGSSCALSLSNVLLANASGSGIAGVRSTSGRFAVAGEGPAPSPPPAAPPPSPPPPTFFDVVGHWARDSIETMCSQGVVGGLPDGSFRPDDPVSRAQFAKIMVNALSLPPVEGGGRSFRDVPATHWAYSSIQGAAPYLPGYSDGTYRPDAAALREDVAAALVRALGWEYETVDPARLAGFTDGYSIPSALRNLVAIAVDRGLLAGYPDGSFRGKGTLTRAQACVVVLRAQRMSGAVTPGIPWSGTGMTPPSAPPPALSPSPQPSAGGTALDPYLVDAYRSGRNAYLDTREPLTMGGVEYTRGVSWKIEGYSWEPRAPSCVAFNLGGRFSRLTGKVGLDDRAAEAEETVRLVGDGSVLKTVKLRPGDLPASLDLDVRGVQNLRIEVDNMHYQNVMDAVDFVGWR